MNIRTLARLLAAVVLIPILALGVGVPRAEAHYPSAGVFCGGAWGSFTNYFGGDQNNRAYIEATSTAGTVSVEQLFTGDTSIAIDLDPTRAYTVTVGVDANLNTGDASRWDWSEQFTVQPCVDPTTTTVAVTTPPTVPTTTVPTTTTTEATPSTTSLPVSATTTPSSSTLPAVTSVPSSASTSIPPTSSAPSTSSPTESTPSSSPPPTTSDTNSPETTSTPSTVPPFIPPALTQPAPICEDGTVLGYVGVDPVCVPIAGTTPPPPIDEPARCPSNPNEPADSPLCNPTLPVTGGNNVMTWIGAALLAVAGALLVRIARRPVPKVDA